MPCVNNSCYNGCMANRFLSDASIELLAAPQERKIICSRFPSTVRPLNDPRHKAWARKNTDHHPHLEVMAALCGETVYGFRGETYPCPPGTIMIFAPLEEHDSYYPPWSPDADHLWFHFAQGSIFFSVLNIRDGTIETRILGGRLEIPAALSDYLRQSLLPQVDPLPVTETARLLVEAALSILIFEVIQAGYRAESRLDKEDFHRRIIMAIERHIRETAGCGISLKSLARMSGYSPFHFERIFKQHTGRSVHRYIDECRRARVREMLAGDCKMKEISYALGFSCPSAFSRWYKANH